MTNRYDESLPVAIEGQFDGIFHNTTTITSWERWRGIWEFHAGKPLTMDKEVHSLLLLNNNFN